VPLRGNWKEEKNAPPLTLFQTPCEKAQTMPFCAILRQGLVAKSFENVVLVDESGHIILIAIESAYAAKFF